MTRSRFQGPQTELGNELYAVKGNRPWREVAEETGIAEGTLHRLNRAGKLMPEMARRLEATTGRDFGRFVAAEPTRRPADEEDELRALIAQVADDRVTAQAETRDDLALLRQVLEQLAQRVSLLEARLTESRGLGTQ